MRYTKLFIGIFLLLPLANASLFNSNDITFSVNQSDYYFKTGENAIIPLNIENTYGKNMDGTLIYTYTQKVNQGGMQMSSSNSQSISFIAQDGENEANLNFGTSSNPSTLDVNLKFNYNDGKDQRIVEVDGITIHFVSDDNQKQNQQNQQSSSSKKYSQSQQQNTNNQQDPISQMQQQINQMMNNNQQQQPQNQQQALQNNQMNQDSSALKKQMEQQLQEQQQMKQEFQKKLAQNPDFQKEHQDLLNKGYNITSANLNPSSNNTGDFKLNYKNQNGDEATFSGHMENGTMQNIQKETPESRQKILNELEQNKQFQRYEKKLNSNGYQNQTIDISSDSNKTTVKIDYASQNNETAIIRASMINDTVEDVELENFYKNKTIHWWIFIVFLSTIFLAYLVYRKFPRKKIQEPEILKEKTQKPFNYKSESKKLLTKSKKLFEQKKYKDAYGTAGQALRLYLSFENKLNKEVTNDEIIEFLRKNEKSFKEVKDCFDLCSLVEFAKYQANKNDFDKIISKASKIIM